MMSNIICQSNIPQRIGKMKLVPILKKKIMAVEGKDECFFFEKFLKKTIFTL